MQAGEIPIQKSISLASWADVSPDPEKGQHRVRFRVKFRLTVIEAPGLEGVFPDPKDLIDCVERIDFEFVISVFASDKHFKVVVIVDLGIALNEGCPDIGFFSGVT